jgi:hypothetical protein
MTKQEWQKRQRERDRMAKEAIGDISDLDLYSLAGLYDTLGSIEDVWIGVSNQPRHSEDTGRAFAICEDEMDRAWRMQRLVAKQVAKFVPESKHRAALRRRILMDWHCKWDSDEWAAAA